MEREYDEILADILIHLDQIEQRMEKADRRMDLTIKRVVKIETRIEKVENSIDSIKNRLELFLKDQSVVNSDVDAKLTQLFKKI